MLTSPYRLPNKVDYREGYSTLINNCCNLPMERFKEIFETALNYRNKYFPMLLSREERYFATMAIALLMSRHFNLLIVYGKCDRVKQIWFSIDGLEFDLFRHFVAISPSGEGVEIYSREYVALERLTPRQVVKKEFEGKSFRNIFLDLGVILSNEDLPTAQNNFDDHLFTPSKQKSWLVVTGFVVLLALSFFIFSKAG